MNPPLVFQKKVKMERVASIDIGTNTILLLIARVDEGEVKPLFEMETIVRLGEGVQSNGALAEEAMKRGLHTLTQYIGRCREMGVQRIFAVGTSALREAQNSKDFLSMIKGKLNLDIEIISGEEEAQLSFLSVTRDLKEINPSTFPGLKPGVWRRRSIKKPILVVDVGGGSTEFILGKGDTITQWVSLPLGSVRFAEQFLISDPVQGEEWEKMERAIRKMLPEIPHAGESFSMVALGGTATTLASVAQGLEEFMTEKIHHFVLQKEALKDQLMLYRSKTLNERKRIPGLPSARADVILAGGAILYMAMEELGCPSTLISCHGVRYGVLYKRLNGGNGLS